MNKQPEDIEKENWRLFGKWMLDTRSALNLTQEQCAQRADMKRQQWNRLELGASTKRATVIRIADALNADRAEALDMAGFKQVALPGTITAKSNITADLSIARGQSPAPYESTEETLRSAFLFGGEPFTDEEIEKLRPYMEMLDREIDRVRALSRQKDKERGDS